MAIDRRKALKKLIQLAGVFGLTPIVGTKRSHAFLSSYFSLGAGAADAAPAAKPTRRLAIVGGGMGGLATAWFCGPEWNVELFEARHKLGGHCDSETVEVQGKRFTVDLGAQFFHPDTHPLYLCLLEQLGLNDQSFKSNASLSIFELDRESPYFVSTHPIDHLIRAIDFAIYSQAARKAVLKGLSYDITLAEWIEKVRVDHEFKERIFLPMLSSMIGTTPEKAARSSARSILQTFALSFPRNILSSPTTWNSHIGLQGILLKMLDRCENLVARTGTAVTGLKHKNEHWWLETAAGQHGPFDAVVINATPGVSKPLVAPLPWAGELAGLLGRYEYFDSRIVIHTDPVYMNKSHRNWAVYNAGIEHGNCEGSVWLGQIEEPVQGHRISLFKSWATHRSREPEHILFERRFKHPLITPDSIRAARELQRWQGHNGLWFAGQHTTGFDLQESALYSAMKVAERLAPDSRNLTALKARAATKGMEHLRYDL